jgi:hypothetical protein
MKLSSLFKGKVYTFPQTQNQEQDKSFALEVIKKIKPNLVVSNISVGDVKDYYDVFIIKDDEKKTFKLKISLDDSQEVLKKEYTVTKNSKSSSTPISIEYGVVKIGDEITYLLVEVPPYESVGEYGRSSLLGNFESFVDSYFVFQKTKGVRTTYKTSLDKFLKNVDPASYLPQESIEALKSYTDYDLCKGFVSSLSEEIRRLSQEFILPYKHKCHGGLSVDNVFTDGGNFYFDDFKDVFMGHPYVDFIDIILDLGLPKDAQYSLLSTFCQRGGVAEDRTLFKSLYEIQLRKKLLILITEYIKEVYVYDSYRYNNILSIANTFSHCYERFCDVEMFHKNKDFIMKTICEPIFGVKA